MQYEHLNYEQRYTIECMLKQNHSKKLIYSTIGVSESTLYRELHRNKKPKANHNAKYAQMLADERCKEDHVKKHFTKPMQTYIIEKLTKYQWSPEQIVGRAKLEGVQLVSHERIYQFICQDKSNGGLLYTHLRTSQKKYKKRYGSKSSRGQIPDKVSIEQRPEIVDQKIRIADFESDLIIGKDHKRSITNHSRSFIRICTDTRCWK